MGQGASRRKRAYTDSERGLASPRNDSNHKLIIDYKTALSRFPAGKIEMMRHVFNELAIQSTSGYGSLDKTTFLRYFPLPGIMGERLFSVFDLNDSGDISFQEFVTGMALVYHGTIDEKQKFLFEMYDLDGDGVVTRDELTTMLSHVPTAFRLLEMYILQAPGSPTNNIVSSAVDEDHIKSIVDAAFSSKPSGVLSFPEFKDLLSSTPAILEVLNVLYDDALPQRKDSLVVENSSKQDCPMCRCPVTFSHCLNCGVELKYPGSCHACQFSIPIINFCFHCGQPLRHSAAQPSVPSLSRERGFLVKKSRWLKRNLLRYFILREPYLYYFLKKDDTEPNGVIFLVGCEIQKSDSLSFEIIPLSDIKNSRSFRAASESERDSWVEALTRASRTRQISDYYTVDWDNPIGKGKFSTVYPGISITTRIPVAVKLVNNRDITPKERELIRTEIAAAKLVRHANVVLTFDIFESLTSIYVVMERVNGGDLLTQVMLRPGRRLNECEALTVVKGMLAALTYLHQRGIVHRDIKPENTLVELDSNGDIATVKLTDFGLCAIVAHGYTMEAQLGTIEYAAPEIILNHTYDKAVDLWSLGCVVYVILSGRLPFSGKDERDTATRITRGRYDFQGDNWDPEAIDFIRHLIVRNPRHRFTTTQALAHNWILKSAKP